MTTTQRKTPFIGFLLSIRAVLGIFEDYIMTRKMQYLLTYKLSQVS